MTTDPTEALLSIALDLTTHLSHAGRSQRLVDAVRSTLPCDAVALLRLDGEQLLPLAAHGLTEGFHGQRFELAQHPRLAAACGASGPLLFPADSPLPDPYDGLVDGENNFGQVVHSCLACPLRVEGELVGVLTVDALVAGAFDDVPTHLLEHLAALAGASLRTGLMIEELEESARHERLLHRDLARDVSRRRGGIMLGRSAPMEALRSNISMIAGSDYPVLITGETGTGKELVAHQLHAKSARSQQALIYVNCAALPESIAESELFGHVQGAFTGALEARLGKFSMADGASLFLDEIGELPLALQAKLLRALQGGEIQRVGSDEVLHVDVRILAATNRKLHQEVAAGRFREDLLHRLDVCRIQVPALRDHRDDVPELVAAAADDVRRHLGIGPIRFSPDAMAQLKGGRWPGNVRELQNVVSRAVLHASQRYEIGHTVWVQGTDCGDLAWSDGGTMQAASDEKVAHLGRPPAGVARGLSFSESMDARRLELIRIALGQSGGNWAGAARILKMNRSNLQRLDGRLGMR